ncbi:unnamed protein product [Calicophoron daubneyi]|uniref:Aminoacyl-transfer RNA synthetases class-II family profile domain-containing protein n=1 Tax=Calicophoron daubneyi TaxID=300641 RepID=A0AAV2TSH8_CALDB
MIRDFYGIVQVYLPSGLLQKGRLDLPATESVVKITGTVRARPAKDVNTDLSTGEIEVIASSLQVLSAASSDVPFTQKDKTPINETLRLTHRAQKSSSLPHGFLVTSIAYLKVLNNLNNFLWSEVLTDTCRLRAASETNLLAQTGSLNLHRSSRLVTLITLNQLDLEMCFVTADDVLHVVEQLLLSVWPLVQLGSGKPPDLTFPFPRMDYSFAISRFGTDKPDIRFDFGFCDTTPDGLIGFKVPSIYAHELNAENWAEMHRKIQEIVSVPVLHFKVDHPLDGTHHLLEAVRAEPADTVVFARGYGIEEKKALGLARTELASMLHEKGLPIYKPGIHFLWVQNFPLFERDETGKFISVHHPFTAPTEDTLPSLYSDPEKVVGQHYDLVCNGQEIGGGSIRIHDASLQRYILSAILHEETADMEYFITALKFGAPPHGGIALGLDRLISIFLGTKSIRDVIAFPKSADGKDLMCKAPAKARKEDLDYYGITITDSV